MGPPHRGQVASSRFRTGTTPARGFTPSSPAPPCPWLAPSRGRQKRPGSSAPPPARPITPCSPPPTPSPRTPHPYSAGRHHIRRRSTATHSRPPRAGPGRPPSHRSLFLLGPGRLTRWMQGSSPSRTRCATFSVSLHHRRGHRGPGSAGDLRHAVVAYPGPGGVGPVLGERVLVRGRGVEQERGTRKEVGYARQQPLCAMSGIVGPS